MESKIEKMWELFTMHIEETDSDENYIIVSELISFFNGSGYTMYHIAKTSDHHVSFIDFINKFNLQKYINCTKYPYTIIQYFKIKSSHIISFYQYIHMSKSLQTYRHHRHNIRRF